MSRGHKGDASVGTTETGSSDQRDDAPPTPGASEATGRSYQEVRDSAEFAELRRRLRVFVFPMSAAFLAWYLLYVLLADYAHDFMSRKLFSNINVGLVFGLLQFVSTFGITTAYVWYANSRLDPAARKIRDSFEGKTR